MIFFSTHSQGHGIAADIQTEVNSRLFRRFPQTLRRAAAAVHGSESVQMFFKLPCFSVVNINAGQLRQRAAAPGELKAELSRARKSRQG